MNPTQGKLLLAAAAGGGGHLPLMPLMPTIRMKNTQTHLLPPKTHNKHYIVGEEDRGENVTRCMQRCARELRNGDSEARNFVLGHPKFSQ